MSDKCWLDERGGRRWRACVHCEVHGWVDEEIAWKDAKTAFKACQLARERHFNCGGDERRQAAAREFALEQINAAGAQLAHYRRRCALARERAAELERQAAALEYDVPHPAPDALADAAARLAAAERDVMHAAQRLDDVIESNGAALPL